MKKIKLAILATLCCLHLSSVAQITFESGYFVRESGDSVTCLIKNVEWKSTPSQFEYKLTENSESQMATVDQIRSFGFVGGDRFIRFHVNIDKSKTTPDGLTRVRTPEFSAETVFLKVLIEGKASLYTYQQNNTQLFFFSVDNAPVEQLVYKRFLVSATQIGTNEQYKVQLKTSMICADITESSTRSVRYTQSSLSVLFLTYNRCHGTPVRVDEKRKSARQSFNISLHAGVHYANFKLKNSRFAVLGTDFNSGFGYRLGLNLQLTFPYNKGKWAVFLEPTYISFESEGKSDPATVDYKAIEFPLGIRYNFFLSNGSKIFIKPAVVVDLKLNSSLYDQVNFEVGNHAINFAMGVGYSFKRFEAELRYYTTRDILDDYIGFKGNFQSTALILGYRIY
jgi:hypothetical protein